MKCIFFFKKNKICGKFVCAIHDKERFQAESCRRKLCSYSWMSKLCWLQWCMGQPSSQPSFIQMLQWEVRVGEKHEHHRDLSLFTLVTEQTIVYNTAFQLLTKAWGASGVGRFSFLFLFHHLHRICLTFLFDSLLFASLTVNEVMVVSQMKGKGEEKLNYV